MPAIGEICDRPEAGGRDRWRAGTEAEVEQLERLRRLRKRMGGAESIARQHAQGRLTVREPHSVTARRLRRWQRALTLREGMMGRWAPAGMSRGLSALVTLFPPGRCGYATPVIAPARGRSHLPCGAPSSILT